MRSLPKLGQLECTEFKKTLPLLPKPLHRHFTTYVWECTCNIPLSLNHFTLKTQKNLPSFVARSKFCSQRLCCCIYSCLSYLQFRSFFSGSSLVGHCCYYWWCHSHLRLHPPPTTFHSLHPQHVTCNALFLCNTRFRHPYLHIYIHTQLLVNILRTLPPHPLALVILSVLVFWCCRLLACWHSFSRNLQLFREVLFYLLLGSVHSNRNCLTTSWRRCWLWKVRWVGFTLFAKRQHSFTFSSAFLLCESEIRELGHSALTSKKLKLQNSVQNLSA